VWQFANGGDDEFYLGSADWMPRNFDRRVEAVAPVEDPRLHERLRALLALYLEDTCQSWRLDSDGLWSRRNVTRGAPPRASHELLQRNSWGTPRETTSKNEIAEPALGD
jgi:polyphosphate kinase